MIYSAWKSGIEILTTLYINFGVTFGIPNTVDFAHQFQMNYFGVDSQSKGRIPGIIEQRFF